MVRCVNIPYKDEALKIYDNAIEQKNGNKNYITNKVFKNKYGKYIYINQKNFLHLLLPQRMKVLDGEILYCYIDLMLNKDGRMKDTGKTSRFYNTPEELVDELEKLTKNE